MEHITEDGEVVQGGALMALGNSMVGNIARAEIDAQIATAKAFPRDIRKVISNITTLATLDEETAQECLYALVRTSKKKKKGGGDEGEANTVIEGPSIRLAEIAMQCFGNCRAEARVIEIDRVNMEIVAEGIFLDLEANSASKSTVRRRIGGKYGLFSADMITVTGNAACSIAKRNAILAGVPRGIYRQAYQMAREIVAGTAETLTKNRDKAIKAFANFGVKPDQLLEKLEVESELELTQDHIVRLRGMFAALKNGEASVEEMFGKEQSAPAPLEKNPLVDKAEPEKPVEEAKAEPEASIPQEEDKAAPEQDLAAEKPIYALSDAGEIVADGTGKLTEALKRAGKGTAALERWLAAEHVNVEKALAPVMPQLRKIADRVDTGEAS